MKIHNVIRFTGFLLICIVSPSHADIYPGANCHAYYGVESNNFTNSDYSIANNSSSSQWVNCPLPTHGVPNSRVVFTVQRPTSNTSSLDCFVSNRSNSGSWRGSASIRIYSINSTFNRTVLTNAQAGTHYQNFYCLLPSGSQLLWYKTEQF
jgi:hypothetical protein